jgi:hypothetical protein
MSDETPKIFVPTPLQGMSMATMTEEGGMFVDFDKIRQDARSFEEATIPLTPDIVAILNQWKSAQLMNANRSVPPEVKPTPPSMPYQIRGYAQPPGPQVPVQTTIQNPGTVIITNPGEVKDERK